MASVWVNIGLCSVQHLNFIPLSTILPVIPPPLPPSWVLMERKMVSWKYLKLIFSSFIHFHYFQKFCKQSCAINSKFYHSSLRQPPRHLHLGCPRGKGEMWKLLNDWQIDWQIINKIVCLLWYQLIQWIFLFPFCRQSSTQWLRSWQKRWKARKWVCTRWVNERVTLQVMPKFCSFLKNKPAWYCLNCTTDLWQSESRVVK